MTKPRLKIWRLEAGLSQDEFARQVGIKGANPAATYGRYEKGARQCPASIAQAIVDATCGAVTVEDLHQANLEYVRSRRPVSVK